MSFRMKVFGWHPLLLLVSWVLAVLAVNMLNYYGPRIEGMLFPVALATETTIEAMNDGTMQVGGAFDKYRDCELLGRTAYIEDPVGNKIIVGIAPAAPVALRPVKNGLPWGPWIVTLPAWYREATFSAITVHQCHPLWQTQTTFVRQVIH